MRKFLWSVIAFGAGLTVWGLISGHMDSTMYVVLCLDFYLLGYVVAVPATELA
jgi:hypothetical protein